MTTVRYFVAGDPKSHDFIQKLGGYEESFFTIIDKTLPNVLQTSPEACKFDHLAHGMTEEFFNKTHRIFRVTVEEIPREEIEKRSTQI